MQGKAAPILFLLPLLLISSATLLAQESRFVLMREGSACGGVTLRVEHLRNGYVQYHLREERSVITIDDRREEQLLTVTILADTALRMVSLDGALRRGGEEWKLRGSCVQGTLHLSRENNQGRIERWRSDCGAVPDIMLPELIRRGSPALPARVFFLHDLQDHPASIVLEQIDGGVYRIVVNDVHEFDVDSQGRLLSRRHADHGVSWEMRATAPTRQVCDIDCGVFWDLGRAALSTTEQNVRRMDVVLQLDGHAGAHLVPLDARQAVRDSEDFGTDAVRLQVSRTRARFDEAILPILEKELVPFLKEGALLPVRSDRIRDRAGILRNWDRNAAHVAADILQWCGEEFTPDPFIPVIAADRLVRDPRGNALHAAILFVTLARSAGVPARFVLGAEIHDGGWRSTVWAEAWSKEWVSVNPMAGEILDDATHLKFLHAADIEELRAQAARLRGKLRIEVRDVEVIDASEAGDLATGILGTTYTNRKYRCVIEAPPRWILEERHLGEETVLLAMPELGSAARFEMHLFRNPYRLHTDDLFSTRLRTVLGVLEDPDIEEKGEMRLSDRKVPYVLYSYRSTAAKGVHDRIRTADCILGIADRGYILRFTAPAEHFDAHAGALQEILQSLKIFDRD